MQVLYAAQRQETATSASQLKMYRELIRRSFQLYLQNLLIFQRTATYAKQDQARRRTKHLPSEQDKAFTAILATNPSIDYLTNSFALKRLYEQNSTGQTIDADQISKLYRGFLKTEEYQAYLAKEAYTSEEHRNVLLFLYKWLQSQEVFLTMVEDHFPLWDEDKSLIIGAMKKTIKALPADDHFFDTYRNPSETITDFGDRLIKFVIEADEQLLEKVKPVLQNWDVDRVAIIDMILIKMALAEFLHFPSIPPTVSLNEYVEISKQY
ncbi:MAG: transcription antitermination factor NusB, partial [Bacteroidota bacterium]